MNHYEQISAALADQDLETASPEMKEAIMLARRLIVYGSQGWTVGGAVSEFDKETGEVNAPAGVLRSMA